MGIRQEKVKEEWLREERMFCRKKGKIIARRKKAIGIEEKRLVLRGGERKESPQSRKKQGAHNAETIQ